MEATRQCVTEFLPKVEMIANRMARRLPNHAELDRDDLMSIGAIGLLEAVASFDESRGVKFHSFAEYRIKGAMLDALRRQDRLSRPSRSKVRRIDEARAQLRLTATEEPRDAQVAQACGLELDTYHRVLQTAEACAHPASLDEKDGDGLPLLERLVPAANTDALELMLAQDTRAQLLVSIEALSDRKQFGIKHYYLDGWSVREIAEAQGVSCSQVSRTLSSARRELYDMLHQDVEAEDLTFAA